MSIIYYAQLSSKRTELFQRDREGALKLYLTRYYRNGECYLVASAVHRGYRHALEKEWVVKMTVPRDMPKADMRQAMFNLAPLAGMHLGTDYVVVSHTSIKGE